MVVYLLIAGSGADGSSLQRVWFVLFVSTHAHSVLSLSKPWSVLYVCPPTIKHYLGRCSVLLRAAVDVIPQMLAGSAWLCYSCWGDGHGTGSVYILPREHLVFIRLFKNPPQPLRADWRVACIGAHCLPAGHRSASAHTYTI